MSKLGSMKAGGEINRRVMEELFVAARPGVSLKELDALAEKLIREKGGLPSFKGFGGFPASICTNIGNTLIHGIPTSHKLKKGDLLTIDQGVFFEGFHTDHASTALVGGGKIAFLEAGVATLKKAISKAVTGNRVGDISFAIQSTIKKAGYFVVRDYVGHGVGEKLHENPQIPCFGKPNTGPKLFNGQTLAIEIMYLDQKSPLDILEDNWTIWAKGAKLAALFEKTIMVRRNSPLVLT